MTFPLITVGITCYNAADTIGRAICSAIAQDWPNTEIIIVDDCSSDNSVSVVQEVIKDIPHARLICHEQNKKPSGARNTIIAHSKGEYIAFFDDDDESLPNRLSEQYSCLTEYQKKTGHANVVCYASGVRHYSNGYKKPLLAVGSNGECPKGAQIIDYLLFYQKDPDVFYGSGTPSCSLFIPSELIRSVNGFDESFVRVEDVDLAVRLGLVDTHFIGTQNEAFVQYASSGHDKTPEKNLQAELRLAEKYKDYLLGVSRYYYASHWPYVRYYHFTRQYCKLFGTLAGLFVRYPWPIMRHFCTTAPRRFFHERRMRKM